MTSCSARFEYRNILLAIPGQQRQIQDERNPIPINQEEEGQESVYSGFGDDVGVQAVTEVDGVNVIAGAKLACAQQDAGHTVLRMVPYTEHQASLYRLTIPNRCT